MSASFLANATKWGYPSIEGADLSEAIANLMEGPGYTEEEAAVRARVDHHERLLEESFKAAEATLADKTGFRGFGRMRNSCAQLDFFLQLNAEQMDKVYPRLKTQALASIDERHEATKEELVQSTTDYLAEGETWDTFDRLEECQSYFVHDNLELLKNNLSKCFKEGCYGFIVQRVFVPLARVEDRLDTIAECARHLERNPGECATYHAREALVHAHARTLSAHVMRLRKVFAHFMKPAVLCGKREREQGGDA
jgi:hypothetical protein